MKPFDYFYTGQQPLDEKLIVVNKGQRHGQVIFLAGGGGSGKGFVFTHMVDSNSYKVVNPDDIKPMLIALGKKGTKGYEQYANMSLKNPADVAKLHHDVEVKGFEKKIVQNLLSGNRSELPNLCFDKTMKTTNSFYGLLPDLFKAGYQSKGIHIIWVLTDYSVALKQNAKRSRSVPEDILLLTHTGAAVTMRRLIMDGYPETVDGEVYVVLGGPGNTVFWTDPSGRPLAGGDNKPVVVKDFKYLKIKEAGQRIDISSKVVTELVGWIRQYAPPGAF